MIKDGKRRVGLIAALASLAFCCLPKPSYAAWSSTAKAPEGTTASYSSQTTKTAICYNKSTNIYYYDLKKALDGASSGQKVYLISGKSITQSESITVKSGVEFILPYNSSEGTLSFTDSTTGRNCLLTMSNGADITINSGGTITIGGVLGTRGLVGAYSEIALKSGSSITVNGILNAYGKVTENGAVTGYVDATHVTYDNSTDSGRYVLVSSSGSVVSAIGCYDIGGGNALINKINNNVCPTYNFEFPCLQTYVNIQHGGSLDAYAYVEISGSQVNAKCGVVYPSSVEGSTKSMFYQTSGEMSIEYCSTNKTILYMNGYVKMGALYISGAGGYNIDTTNIFIGLTSRYYVVIGGTFDTNNKKIKFLPGCNVVNLPGGTISINGSSNSNKSQVIFYEANSFTSLGISTYGNTKSVFINNGTVTLNQYGCLAGYVDINTTSGQALLDLSSVTNASNISLTTNEIVSGSSVNIPTIDLMGPFYDANNADNNYITDSLFSVGTSYSSKEGYASWVGEIAAVANISLNVIRTGAKTESYSYSIYTNTTGSGTGTAIMSNITNVRTQSFGVLVGEYMRIVDTTCTAISVNGNSYTSGTWIQVTGDTTIEITPTAAFNIRVYHTHGNSGAGSIQRSVTYGATSSTMNQTKSVSDGSEININIPAGWVFKVSDNASVSGTSQVIKTTYDENGVGTETVIATKNKGIAWSSSTIYTADGDYRFVSDNVTCLIEGTLITMADGSKKMVQDVVFGDMVLAFNYQTGKYQPMPIIFNNHADEERSEYNVLSLIFSDENVVKFVGNHGIFDSTLKKYVFIDEYNYEDYLGHDFITSADGSCNETVTLVDAYVDVESTRIFAPVSYFYMNVLANNILTIAPPVTEDGRTIEGIVNYFEFNEDASWDLDAMRRDIAEYGLYTYDDFSMYITESAYLSSPSVYLKPAVGKGILTYEDIIEVIKYLLARSLIDY